MGGQVELPGVQRQLVQAKPAKIVVTQDSLTLPMKSSSAVLRPSHGLGPSPEPWLPQRHLKKSVAAAKPITTRQDSPMTMASINSQAMTEQPPRRKRSRLMDAESPVPQFAKRTAVSLSSNLAPSTAKAGLPWKASEATQQQKQLANGSVVGSSTVITTPRAAPSSAQPDKSHFNLKPTSTNGSSSSTVRPATHLASNQGSTPAPRPLTLPPNTPAPLPDSASLSMMKPMMVSIAGEGSSILDGKTTLLGLKLRKTPSLLDFFTMRLEGVEKEKAGQRAVAVDPAISMLPSILPTRVEDENREKMKASNFGIQRIEIGSWKRMSMYDGDIIAKCYYGKKKIVWEVLEAGLKSKMEVQYASISSLRAWLEPGGPGVLEIEVSHPPLFFRETNPRPRKHTAWETATDFTQGQATECRLHLLVFAEGALNKPLQKLLQTDPWLHSLAWVSNPSQLPNHGGGGGMGGVTIPSHLSFPFHGPPGPATWDPEAHQPPPYLSQTSEPPRYPAVPVGWAPKAQAYGSPDRKKVVAAGTSEKRKKGMLSPSSVMVDLRACDPSEPGSGGSSDSDDVVDGKNKKTAKKSAKVVRTHTSISLWGGQLVDTSSSPSIRMAAHSITHDVFEDEDFLAGSTLTWEGSSPLRSEAFLQTGDLGRGPDPLGMPFPKSEFDAAFGERSSAGTGKDGSLHIQDDEGLKCFGAFSAFESCGEEEGSVALPYFSHSRHERRSAYSPLKSPTRGPHSHLEFPFSSPTRDDDDDEVSPCASPQRRRKRVSGALSRVDSSEQLLVNLPRVASLPQFL